MLTCAVPHMLTCAVPFAVVQHSQSAGSKGVIHR